MKTIISKEHKGKAGWFALTDSHSDFNIPGHRHKFVGPSCSYTDTTAELYKEAASVEGSELVKHKPCEPNGNSSMLMESFKQDIQDVKDFTWKWLKEAVGFED